MSIIKASIVLATSLFLSTSYAADLEAVGVCDSSTCNDPTKSNVNPGPFKILSKLGSEIDKEMLGIIGTDTRKVMKRSTDDGNPIHRPILRIIGWNNENGTASYISPCRILTNHHVISGNEKYELGKVFLVSNETDANGKAINYRKVKLVSSYRPRLNPTTGEIEAERDLAMLEDQDCRGAKDGYLDFSEGIPSGETNPKDFILPGFPYLSWNPDFNGENLVSTTTAAGCNTKYLVGDLLLHDCDASGGNSGSPLVLWSTLPNPKRNSWGGAIWDAFGVSVAKGTKQANSETCSKGSCNVAIDGKAVLDYIKDAVEKDLAEYEHRHPSIQISQAQIK